MLRYLLSGALLSLIHASAAYADGVAVFASLTDAAGTRQTQDKLEATLDIAVEVSRLDINGTPWVRLHSAVMPEMAARALVERAQRGGYSAWFNGSGDSLVTSSSAVAEALARPTGALVDQPAPAWRGEFGNASSPVGDHRAEDDAGYGIVTPATGDVSHLPFAETFPLDDSEQN